ncbi:MAG TPA: DUF1800 domain-containing protein [Gaiellaceae bacterium]
MSPPPVYRGPFGKPQAERLLWRAGFGPRKGEAEALGKLGLAGAVHRLTNPGFERLVGPKPHDDKGHPLAPYSAWGDDHTWWLDRMVRTSRPLVERMTLIWHDWFATSNDGVGSQKLMLEQNALFRRNALGSFHDLLRDVTANPAMLEWLNGLENEKGSPNENYGREMMELFTLGADRGAYTEKDVREQARALTGWQNRWKRNVGAYDFHFDASEHDTGVKRVFGKSGNFDWRDAVDLCMSHPMHASFFVRKLWGYFVPVPPDHGTQASLEAIYKNGHQVKPVVAAILSHPTLYLGPRLMKPPIVHTAGLLRRLGVGITSTNWAWIGDLCGQRLFYPPNVAGWDDTRWLDTATFRGRWYAVQQMLQKSVLDPSKAKEPYDAKQLVDRAVAFWDNPPLSDGTHYQLVTFAKRALDDAGKATWKQQQYPVLVQNALRQLVAMSPDLQTA